MTQLARALLIVFFALAPTAADAGTIEEAGGVVDRWADAFNRDDAEALVSLYAPDAIFFGMANSTMMEGIGPIRTYITNNRGHGSKIEVGERRVMALSPNAVLSTGFFQLIAMQNGKPMPIPGRYTMLLVKHGDAWLIAHHHSSRRPEPPR